MRSLTKISATSFFCAFLIAACIGAQTKSRKQKVPVYDDRDGYEVLSVILNRLSVVRKNETIRISPATSAGLVVAEIKTQCSGIPEEFHGASEDFDNKTKTKQILQRRFSLTKNYELAYTRLGVDLNQPETREEARRRIRSGTYYVAAVGFDDKRTHAIAFVEYICGNLCGDSIFYFLRKSEKGWEDAPEVGRQVQTCGRIY